VLVSNGCIFNITGLRTRLAEAEEGSAAATARAGTADARAAESAGLLRDEEANAASLQARVADAEAWLADAMRAKETRAAKEAERAAAAEAEAAHQHAMLRASQDQVRALHWFLVASVFHSCVPLGWVSISWLLQWVREFCMLDLGTWVMGLWGNHGGLRP
jgi:hypothetical protein